MYSIGTDANLSMGLNDGDKMDEDGNKGRQVEVVMSEEGLSGKSSECERVGANQSIWSGWQCSCCIRG